MFLGYFRKNSNFPCFPTKKVHFLCPISLNSEFSATLLEHELRFEDKTAASLKLVLYICPEEETFKINTNVTIWFYSNFYKLLRHNILSKWAGKWSLTNIISYFFASHAQGGGVGSSLFNRNRHTCLSRSDGWEREGGNRRTSGKNSSTL